MQTDQKPLDWRRNQNQRLQRIQKYVRVLVLRSNKEDEGFSSV
ncbi:hypothetical protein [Alkaliphilus serpentinus]|nr:hypothetical protein [Alkaliphilus serpentinus]